MGKFATPPPIESRQNAKFKIWTSLLEAKGIKKNGMSIIAGTKLVEEFLSQSSAAALDLLLPEKFGSPALPSHIRIHKLGRALFNELDTFGTGTPLLVVRTPELLPWKAGKPQGLNLIVALSDPGNLGALLRSAEAFGTTRVILTAECCSPFLPKVIRASSGACMRLLMERAPALPKIVDITGYSLNMHGQPLPDFTWPKNLYLVLGEEGQGVPESMSLTPLSIPMRGQTESLNATTAASIAMYEYSVHQKQGKS